MTDTLEYDATGLLCPLPVLRANRKLRELDAELRLEVERWVGRGERTRPATFTPKCALPPRLRAALAPQESRAAPLSPHHSS